MRAGKSNRRVRLRELALQLTGLALVLIALVLAGGDAAEAGNSAHSAICRTSHGPTSSVAEGGRGQEEEKT